MNLGWVSQFNALWTASSWKRGESETKADGYAFMREYAILSETEESGRL